MSEAGLWHWWKTGAQAQDIQIKLTNKEQLTLNLSQMFVQLPSARGVRKQSGKFGIYKQHPKQSESFAFVNRLNYNDAAH